MVQLIIDDVMVVVNISLTTGDFIEELKTVIIKLPIKNVTMEPVSTSYRPVSNIKFLSKVVECCMLSQFDERYTLHRLFYHISLHMGQTTVVRPHYSNYVMMHYGDGV